MELERVAYGNCGAGLQVPDGVEYITCRHCGSSLRVQHTESVTFTSVMQSLQKQSDRIAENTDVLRLQNEILLLDQEWEQRSSHLMVHGKHGPVSTPDKTSSVIGGVFITVFGLAWTIIAGSFSPVPAIFALMFVGFGLWNCVSTYRKAESFARLQAEHERKRSRILSQLRSLEKHRSLV
ncbi:hypothetical protein GC163_16420 [bacterium]|nr:hypothetical protein [bacterium]